MIKDEFDKQFGNIDYHSNSELTEQSRRAKIANSQLGVPKSEKTKNNIKKAYASAEMRAMQAAKAKPHTKESKEKLRQVNIGKKRKGEQWIESMSSKQKGNQYRNKPFMTPSGAFASKKIAVDWATENGVNNAKGKFDKWIKQRPDEFCYITPEEYELIKDNPKQVGLEWMQNTKRQKNK